MSEHDEFMAEQARDEDFAKIAAAHFFGACRCGNDMPGFCPGADRCPMCDDEVAL